MAKHVVPGEAVRATLRSRGVDSVNLATQWAAVNGITPSRIVAIVRGKRAWVPAKHADEIAVALDSPELWFTEWAEWANPPGEEGPDGFGDVVRMFNPPPASGDPSPGDRVRHRSTGAEGKFLWRAGEGGAVVDFDGEEARVVPASRLERAGRRAAA